jgi:hypothetical protein
MFTKTKYVITDRNIIIIFPEYIEHRQFSSFNPISAGFISIGVNGKGAMSCQCYGESISLGLASRPEDTEIAARQLNMMD